jgi:hypothetical protein
VVPGGTRAQMNIVPTPHNPFEVNLDDLMRLSPMERTLRSVRLPAPTSPHLSATTERPQTTETADGFLSSKRHPAV